MSVALIAEIGNNHEGSVSRAEEMIETAFAAGAHAVKLQTFVPDLFVSRTQPARLETLRRFALPPEALDRLLRTYAARGLPLFSTPLDLVSLNRLSGAPLLKISSGDVTYTQLLRGAALAGKDLILSTGAATMAEVSAAVATIVDTWTAAGITRDLGLLHCVSAYPAPPESVNLRAIATLRDAFPSAVVGYSDHTLGIDVAVTAAAAGARIIEKHFTLDKHFSDFRDHRLSADPDEFAELRSRLQALDVVLGTGVKEPTDVEVEMRTAIRRSVTAARDLPVGHTLEADDLCVVRPAAGVEPARMETLIGRRLANGLSTGQAVSDGDLS
ncbi:MAG: N-acetylneuraminate synthase family protein [Vicinamibacterales bacterium]